METLKFHILEMDNLENNTLNKNTNWCLKLLLKYLFSNFYTLIYTHVRVNTVFLFQLQTSKLLLSH